MDDCCSSYSKGDRGGSHGMRPVSDKAHEKTESAADERKEHMTGMEAKHMYKGGKGSRRTKGTPGMFYSDGMAGMCHQYGGGMSAAIAGNMHEFKGGGMKGKTPFLKKLMAKKGK